MIPPLGDLLDDRKNNVRSNNGAVNLSKSRGMMMNERIRTIKTRVHLKTLNAARPIN